MHNVVDIVAPVFGLIALGFLLARFRIVSAAAGAGLAEFVFTVAIPVLLFRMMITAKPGDHAPFNLWGAYYGATAIVWISAALLTAFLLRRPLRDGASIAMASCYANIVMLGIPLALDRFGAEAAAPTAFIVSVSAPLLWFSATLHMELADKGGRALQWSALLRELASSLLRNPIIIALLSGLLWRQTGLGIHPVPDKMITLLGQAAVPGALVALGLTLTGFKVRGQAPTVAVIVALSLIAYPAVAWLLAFQVFHLPPVWAATAVILSACPPGANAYLFASRYRAAVNSAAAAVALGTALSIVSVTLVLVLLDLKLHP